MADEPIRTIGALGSAEAAEAATEVEVEPEVDPGPQGPLDEIKAELDAEIARDDLTLAVPGRDGYEARFRTTIEAKSELERWRKASKDRKALDGVDELGFALRILSHTNVAIVRRGEVVPAGPGVLTFRSQMFLDLLGEGRVMDAVRKFYGGPKFAGDGHILTAATEVVRAAGYGDDLSALAADPTVAR